MGLKLREEQEPQTLVDAAAERAVLGAVLADPERLQDLEDMRPEEFGEPVHAMIFQGLVGVARAGRAVNHLSVAEYLKDNRLLVAVGGPGNLMALDEALGRVSNGIHSVTAHAIADQVARVRDLAARRAGRAALLRLADELFDMRTPGEEVLLKGSGFIAALAGAGAGGIRTGTDFMQEEMERIDAIQRGDPDNVQYVPTGLEMWDELIGGLPRGFVTVVGAQASVGKSSLIGTMALSLAEGDVGAGRNAETVAVFSLEDRGGWMPRRWLAESCDVAIRQLMKKGLSSEALDNVYRSANALAPITDRILVDDRRRLTVHRVAAKMRQLHAQRGVRVFFVDHLLEMLDKRSTQARDLLVGEILEVLRDVAVELDVAVVLACHLRDPENPQVDSRYLRPKMQDFAGGQFVNRMARVAVGLWLPPAPPEPKPPKEVPEPKHAARATPEEKATAMRRWEGAKMKAQTEWAQRHEEWKERCAVAAESLVITALKATEGGANFDFTMRRVLHAGTLRRKGGARDMAEMGFSSPRRQ